MAKKVEGSDTDGAFPDLEELLRGNSQREVVGKAEKKTTSTSTTSRLSEVKQANGGSAKGEEGKRSDGEDRERGVEKIRAKKKRVLGIRDDNPLLRPLGKGTGEDRVSSALRGGERVKSGLKSRGVGKGYASKAVPVELDAASSGVDLDGVDAGCLKFHSSSHRDPDSESIRVKGRVPTASKRVVSEDVGKKSQVKPGPANILLDYDDSGKLAGLKALSTSARKDEELLASFRTLRVSNMDSADPLRPALPQERGKSNSKRVNLDSDEESDGSEEEYKSVQRVKARTLRKHRNLPPKTKSRFILTDTEEEDSSEDDDSDGMSDFIVSDNESLEEEGDDSVFEVPPPATRSARKLIKGRRPRMDEAGNGSSLESDMGKLRVDDDDDDVFGSAVGKWTENNERLDEKSLQSLPTTRYSGDFPSEHKAVTEGPPDTKMSEAQHPSSDMEDPFTLRFTPSENKHKVSKEAWFTTPPGSPKLKPRVLPSPAKLPRIPASPHRQSSDAFWSQEVVNDWNDEYSPRKAPKPPLKTMTTLSDGTLLFSPRKSPTKQDRLTKDAKKEFSQIKHSLAESFLKELDKHITSGKIAELAASTGGVKIIWSKKLNTTAGRANWKRETIRSKATSSESAPPAISFKHHASIELAEKVIDDQDRLLNVIAHEFCHLANFMVSNIRTNPHGKEFKAWAAKCSRAFGDRGIEVTTKHSYEIEYKYIWECENCGMEFKRHSKSIDTGKHRCGVCKAKLVQTKPVPRAGGKERLTGYQAFVKENMGRIREENPGSPQKVIMGLVGKRYQEFKATKLREAAVGDGGVEVIEVESKEGSPVEEDLGNVARKLVFLDLTSP